MTTKLFSSILIALTAISCTNAEDTSAEENDGTAFVGEIDVEISEEYQQELNGPQLTTLQYTSMANQIKDSLVIENPYRTIKNIFDTYNEYQESTDSPDNLDSLKQSLKILETSDVDEKTLTLVINVWMYYTVTDFLTIEYAEKVLVAHKEQSTIALRKRIENILDWETQDGAPFSDLPRLLERLEDISD
jgi:hypothetical protein